MNNKKSPAQFPERGIMATNHGATNYIDNILSRLDRVKKTGPDRCMARCPVCGGNTNRSLSARFMPDGRTLFHCFKEQCSSRAIVSAMGLNMSALFPPDTTWKPKRFKDGLTHEKRQRYWALLEHECEIIRIGQLMLKHGDEMTENDIKRIQEADQLAMKLRRILHV